MKPNYKNWMPKGMICGTAAGCAVCLVLFLVFGVSGLLSAGIWKTVLTILFLVLTLFLFSVTVWMILLYKAFSYDGKRQLSRGIIDGVAARVVLPEGGCGLDVGCGSGALTIAVAKHNPNAQMTGIDAGVWSIPLSARHSAMRTPKPRVYQTPPLQRAMLYVLITPTKPSMRYAATTYTIISQAGTGRRF